MHKSIKEGMAPSTLIKGLALTLALLVTLVFLASCTTGDDDVTDPLPERVVPEAKLTYLLHLSFNVRTVSGGEVIMPGKDGIDILDAFSYMMIRIFPSPHNDYFDPSLTELVLVLTEEDALNFPDNVITAWPSEDTKEKLLRLNWYLQSEDSRYTKDEETGLPDLSEFPLSYPVTLTDMVDDWEKVQGLWNSVDVRTQSDIKTGRLRDLDAYPEFLEELERLKEQREAEVSE